MGANVLWRCVRRAARGSVLVFLCATTAAHGADEASAPTDTAAPHVTRTLRVKSPSVTVRANPNASQETKQGGGQYAFIDENGALTSTPPADFEFPSLDPAPPAAPIQRRSAVDPNATIVDTSHIHAVLRATVDENGAIAIECLHSTDPAVQKSCTKPHTPAAPESHKVPADKPEDGQ